MTETLPGGVFAQLVVMAGLPGTGKSTLARALAKELSAVVLDKDQARTALFTPDWIEYSRDQDDFVFDLVLKAADYFLRYRKTVFLDGRPFAYQSQVDEVKKFADLEKVDLKIILCDCPPEIVIQRLMNDAGHPAANRDEKLYLDLKAKFEPVRESYFTVNTSQPLPECVTKCLKYLKQ